ncbi:MAG TPA: SDR family oxidoreductase [Acidimicrobiales bacterium]|nr:SDR family oxidoreductase [Acidimicrobiales bacterium]
MAPADSSADPGPTGESGTTGASGLAGAGVLVTGGASGIGAAAVDIARRGGAKVAVLDVQECIVPDVVAVRCDVAEEEQVVSSVKAAHDALGGIDVAVLSAGVGGFGALVDMEAAEWDRVLDVNLRGVFLCLREIGRSMIAAGRGGSIVAVGSVSGTLTERLMGNYSVSKAGVAQLAKVAARELGPFGIRVNTIAPGATETPLFAPTKALPGYQERAAERAALGGLGSAHAVAAAALSLAGMAWVTGQVLAADGGVSLWSPIDPAEALGT